MLVLHKPSIYSFDSCKHRNFHFQQIGISPLMWLCHYHHYSPKIHTSVQLILNASILQVHTDNGTFKYVNMWGCSFWRGEEQWEKRWYRCSLTALNFIIFSWCSINTVISLDVEVMWNSGRWIKELSKILNYFDICLWNRIYCLPIGSPQ